MNRKHLRRCLMLDVMIFGHGLDSEEMERARLTECEPGMVFSCLELTLPHWPGKTKAKKKLAQQKCAPVFSEDHWDACVNTTPIGDTPAREMRNW